MVSNPPYVADDTVLPADVEAEPRVALRAGPVGDEVLLAIAAEAAGWLCTDGAIAMEIGTPAQATSVRDALGGFASTGVRDDHTSRPRVVWARR